MYDLRSLDLALAGSMFAGKVHYAANTGSTNDDCKAAAWSGAAPGTVFVADEQTAGRGRGDHAWHSAAGEGLYMSILLRPKIAPERLTLLPLAVGLAAASAIREATGVNVDLRWPNDLLIDPHKAGGILVESHIEAGKVAFVVAGIGINVHQREFAPGLATPATSLDLASGARVGRQALLLALLHEMEEEAEGLEDAERAAEIPRRVEQVSTWVRGRGVEVHGPQACRGTTEGLDEHGFLRVRTAVGLVTVQTGGLRELI